MFLYDVIFAINVRWIFTRFSTHQTREINSTLRCVLESNAIKKKKKKYTKRFLHSSSRDVFFPIDNHSNSIIQKTVIHETVPTDTDTSLSRLLNHEQP